MKTIRSILFGAGFVLSLNLVHAQTVSSAETSASASASDLAVMLQAVEQTTPTPAESLPQSGTFWSAQHAPGSAEPWPPFPGSMGRDAWALGGNVFLLDDTNVDYDELAAEAEASGLMRPMLSGFNPMMMMTTTDLWLEIGMTNDEMSGLTADLTIHVPSNDTNLFHDLYYTTNLVAPIQWDFAMRCPYINAVVPDLSSPIGFFMIRPPTNGDLTVSTNATPQQLAQLLVPPWVDVTNATYTGATVARGIFTNGNGCGLPMETGVILSSGNINYAIGPNDNSGYDSSSVLGTSGDADLANLVGGGTTHDAAVLEFDIVPTNSFVLQFEYVFASEEYPEFIDRYNDPMAIFVSTNYDGTNWVNSITNDFALVPGTTNVPVTVNTINGGCVTNDNGGSNSPTNAQYYVDNCDPDYSAVLPYAVSNWVFNIQYDGMTVLLTARAEVFANVTNHVKIAIADYYDYEYDSAIFIKAAPCQ